MTTTASIDRSAGRPSLGELRATPAASSIGDVAVSNRSSTIKATFGCFGSQLELTLGSEVHVFGAAEELHARLAVLPALEPMDVAVKTERRE